MLLSVLCGYEGCGRRTQMLSGLCVVHEALKSLPHSKRKVKDVKVNKVRRTIRGHPNIELERNCLDCGCKIMSGKNFRRKRCAGCARKANSFAAKLWFFKGA